MDTILSALLSWQFLFYCLAVGAVVFVIRQIVEYAMVNWWPLKQWAAANKDAKLWRELILPILPICLGVVGAIVAKQYPYPEGFSSASGKLVFGLVGGFSSGLIVKLYNSFLASKVSEFANTISGKMSSSTPSNPECPPPNPECPPAEDKALEDSVRDSIKKDQ